MKERIEEILVKYKLSSSQFADIIGVQRSSISHILSGRNKPSFDFINKILLKYPEINAHWLITGQGSIENSFVQKDPAVNPNGEHELFAQDSENKNDTFKKSEVIDMITSVNSKEKATENDKFNNDVTNVNYIKYIIYIYNDDSFKILNRR